MANGAQPPVMSKGNWIQLAVLTVMLVAFAIAFVASSNEDSREIQHIIDLQLREAEDIQRIERRLDGFDKIIREHDLDIASLKQEVYRE